MEIKKIDDKTFLAEFWIMGSKAQAVFSTREEALCFFEDIKSVYTTEIHSIKECIDKYLATVTSKKSPQTQKWEQHIFGTFLTHLRLSGLANDSGIVEISLENLEAYQMSLVGIENLNPATVNRYFSTIKNFFNKCKQWEFLIKNPCEHVASLRIDPKSKKVWTEQDFEDVYKSINEYDKPLFLFLKLTGARLSSAVKVKVSDIDFSSNAVWLTTKKGPQARSRRYSVPLHTKLKNFLQHRVIGKNPNDYLFLNAKSLPIGPKNFSKRIQKVLQRLSIEDNSKKSLHLHGVRHTFASQMHNAGLTVNEVKNLLGHSSIEVTQQYLHSDTNAMLDKLNKIA